MAVKHFKSAEFVTERSTPQLTFTVQDADGVEVEPGDISAIAFTLRDAVTDGIVNSRDGVDVFNANGGVFTTGSFALQLTSDDTAILGTATSERRILTLDFTFVGGGREPLEVTFFVRNLRDVS